MLDRRQGKTIQRLCVLGGPLRVLMCMNFSEFGINIASEGFASDSEMKSVKKGRVTHVGV